MINLKIPPFKLYFHGVGKIYLLPFSDALDLNENSLLKDMYHLIPMELFLNYNDLVVAKKPFFNYGNVDSIRKMLEDGFLTKENLYNHPDSVEIAASKVKFHKCLEGEDFLPKSAYDLEFALETLSFPIICKPDRGRKGEGIIVLKSKNSEEDLSNIGVFSEKVIFKKEYRAYMFRTKLLELCEKTPVSGTPLQILNESAIFKEFGSISIEQPQGSKKPEEKISSNFNYAQSSNSTIKGKLKGVVETIYKKIGIDIYAIDFCEDMDGKLIVFEINSAAGAAFDAAMNTYREIYLDFYGTEVDDRVSTYLDSLRIKHSEKLDS